MVKNKGGKVGIKALRIKINAENVFSSFNLNEGFYCSLFEYILLESLLKVVNLRGPDWQSNTSNGVLHGIYL